MPFVSGFLRIRDPRAHPDQGLPEGEGPVDPGYGVGIEHPDQGLPLPPPSVWPPPVPSHPIVPAPPGTPPGAIWPPPFPSHGLPGQGGGSGLHPDQGLPPTQPGEPTHPIAGQPGPHPEHPIASNTYWMLVYTPGFGWKYVTVDPSVHPGHDLPGPQPEPTPHR